MLPESSAAPVPIGQALLFSPELELAIEVEERQGRYTLERFRKLRPEAFADCVQLLAAAKPGYEGLRRIAGIVGVHHLTVAAVRDDVDAGKTIDTLRERLSRKMLTAVELLVDRVLESPGSIPPGMLGMVSDQLTKNGELLGNRATGRVEQSERIDIYAQWEEIVEKTLEPGDVREIGLVGGNVLPIEGEPGAANQLGDIDAESADSNGVAPERSTTDPALATTEQPNETIPVPSRRSEEGGRGSEVLPGAGLSRSGYNKQNFPGNGSLRRPQV